MGGRDDVTDVRHTSNDVARPSCDDWAVHLHGKSSSPSLGMGLPSCEEHDTVLADVANVRCTLNNVARLSHDNMTVLPHGTSSSSEWRPRRTKTTMWCSHWARHGQRISKTGRTCTWRPGSGSTTHPVLSTLGMRVSWPLLVPGGRDPSSTVVLLFVVVAVTIHCRVVGHRCQSSLSTTTTMTFVVICLSSMRIVDDVAQGCLPPWSKRRGLLAIASDHSVVVHVGPVDNCTPWKTGAVWAWCPNWETTPGPTVPVLEKPGENPNPWLLHWVCRTSGPGAWGT